MRSISINCFILLLTISLFSVIIYSLLKINFSRKCFHFIATHKLQTCSRSALAFTNLSLLAKLKFNHNESINYTCRRKSELKHSTCINGKWDPEINCNGELLSIDFFRPLFCCS